MNRLYKTASPTLPAAIVVTVDPNHWYDAAATLEANWGRSTWRAIIGRQWPNLVAPRWRIDNHLFRVGQDSEADPTQPGDLFVQSFDPSVLTWSTKRYVRVRYATAPSYFTASVPSTVLILRNSPEQVTVRVAWPQPSSSGVSVYADVTVRAGCRFAEINVAPDTVSTGCALVANPGVAGTSLTAGVRQTSNDADGNRLVLGSADTFTTDTTTTGLALAATLPATTGRFMVGIEEGGSGAVTLDAAQTLIYEWLCAQSETRRVVAL